MRGSRVSRVTSRPSWIRGTNKVPGFARGCGRSERIPSPAASRANAVGRLRSCRKGGRFARSPGPQSRALSTGLRPPIRLRRPDDRDHVAGTIGGGKIRRPCKVLTSKECPWGTSKIGLRLPPRTETVHRSVTPARRKLDQKLNRLGNPHPPVIRNLGSTRYCSRPEGALKVRSRAQGARSLFLLARPTACFDDDQTSRARGSLQHEAQAWQRKARTSESAGLRCTLRPSGSRLSVGASGPATPGTRCPPWSAAASASRGPTRASTRWRPTPRSA